MCVYIYSLNEVTELGVIMLLLRDWLTKPSVGGMGSMPSGCWSRDPKTGIIIFIVFHCLPELERSNVFLKAMDTLDMGIKLEFTWKSLFPED